MTALAIPMAANLAQILLWGPLFWIPPGTSIRPMGEALWAAIIAIFALLSGVVLAVLVITRRRFLLWLPCLALSLTPLPFGKWLFHTISAVRGLIISD